MATPIIAGDRCSGNRGYRMANPRLTANKGASEIRHAILRKMLELENSDLSLIESWAKLRAYIKGMAKRASSKKGGLGRK